MRGLLLAAMSALVLATPSQAAYFQWIGGDPSHPKTAVDTLFTPRTFQFDGAETNVAVVFHAPDPNESIIPTRLLLAGVKPVGWTLLELGAGGNSSQGFGTVGTSVELGQTALGPLTTALEDLGGGYKSFAQLLIAPNGDGLKLGIKWKANVLANGGVQPFDKWRFPPRYTIGYQYSWGAPAPAP